MHCRQKTQHHGPRFARFIHNSLRVDSTTKLQAGSHPNHEKSRIQAVRQGEAVHGKYGSDQALYRPSDRITVSAYASTLSYGILRWRSLRRQRARMFNSLHGAGSLGISWSAGDQEIALLWYLTNSLVFAIPLHRALSLEAQSTN